MSESIKQKFKKEKKNRIKKFFHLIKMIFLAETARIAYWISEPFFEKDIWLVCETQNQAQENGYYLFEWIRKHYPKMDVYYVISAEAPAVSKIEALGNVLFVETFKQIFLMYHAKKIISTHGLWMIPDEIGILKKFTRRHLKAKGVMLNHGIGFLKNGKKFYYKPSFALNDLIIALSEKHKKIFTEVYGYDDEDVIIAGYPRFDDMIDESSKCEYGDMITFMPTFRDGEDNIGENFKRTELFAATVRLMSDPDVLEFLSKHEITLAVYLHQNIQKYSHMLDEFASERVKVIKQGMYNVQRLLKESKCLITDYSSVFFDFIYMEKPFISYQFDYEKFIASRKEKAFLDFKFDLPGYVVDTHQQLLLAIQEIVQNQYSFSEEHKRKSKEFFQYNDTENCRRVFEAIQKLG